MRPIETKETTMNYAPPLGGEAVVGGLPCTRALEVDLGNAMRVAGIYSIWEPTDAERREIAAGANLRLGIIGMEPIPPVSLGLSWLKETTAA